MKGGFRGRTYNDRLIHDPVYEPFARCRGSRFCNRFPRGRKRRHATGRYRSVRDPRRTAHHHPHDGDDAGLSQHDLGRRLRAAPCCGSVSWSQVAAGSRRGQLDGSAFRRSGVQRQRSRPRPSEIFRRQCWISFEPVEGCLHALADYIGPCTRSCGQPTTRTRRVLLGAPAMVQKQPEGLGRDQVSGHEAGGALGFYGLN